MGLKVSAPRLGVDRYASIAAVLMEVIPLLLPSHITRLTTVITTVRGDSNNGFDLMWQLMSLAVPGFDPTQHVLVPVWEDYQIYDFCHAHVLYFCLQAKRGLYYDECTHSLLNMLRWSPHCKLTLNCTRTWLWGTSPLICVWWNLLIG